MKPYRVKRGNKFIGSFIVVHDGQRVNLGTKDASEARRRAALVVKGLWPETGGAASAVKAALEGKEPVDDSQSDTPVDAPSSPPEVLSGGELPASAPHPATPVPEPVASPPAADAVNRMAADAEDEQLLSEAKAAIAESGIDLAEIKAQMPSLLASAHLWVQGQLCRAGVRAAKGRWPKMVTLPADDPLRVLVGKLDAALLTRLDLDVDKIGPGWLLLILSVVTSLAQVGGMLEALAEEEQAAKAAV